MHLVSYDIQNDRLRLKAAKELIRHGLYRVQYSVFMGTASDSAISRLRKELEGIIMDPDWTEEDTFLILPLHQYTRDQLEIIGKLPRDWDLIQANLHTLIF